MTKREHTSEIINPDKLALDSRDQRIWLVSEELDTRDRLRAGQLSQRFWKAFGTPSRTKPLVHIPDVEAKVIAHAIKA